MVVLGVRAAIVLVIIQVMLEYRNYGVREAFFEQQDIPVEFQRRDYVPVDDDFYRLAQLTVFVPNYYPYVMHKYFYYVLVRPIPRVFWRGKPVDGGFDLPTVPGEQGLSYSCTIIGEFYFSLQSVSQIG